MIRSHNLSKAKAFITSQGGVVAPSAFSEEEINLEPQDDLTVQVYPIESMDNLPRVDVATRTGEEDLQFFEDGRQRTIQIGYVPSATGDVNLLIPVHYVVVGAAILRRVKQALEVWGAPIVSQGLIVERSLLPNQGAIAPLEAAGLTIHDSGGPGGDYYELRRRALRKSKDLRLKVENDVITKWRETSEPRSGFLVVDGTLMNFRDEDNVERCLGVSKSFGSRYFSSSDHNRILRMEAGHRSWTFRFHDPTDAGDARLGPRERVSWYLRLRGRPSADPEFGLIRVEVSRRHLKIASALADSLSACLLAERLPTAYPAPRWDKHLYPIKVCEDYLASVMPTASTIQASMGGQP